MDAPVATLPVQHVPFVDGINTAKILCLLAVGPEKIAEVSNDRGKDLAQISVQDSKLAQLGNQLQSIYTPLKEWLKLIRDDLDKLAQEITPANKATLGPKQTEMTALSNNITPKIDSAMKTGRQLQNAYDDIASNIAEGESLLLEQDLNTKVNLTEQIDTKIKALTQNLGDFVAAVKPTISECEAYHNQVASIVGSKNKLLPTPSEALGSERLSH